MAWLHKSIYHCDRHPSWMEEKALEIISASVTKNAPDGMLCRYYNHDCSMPARNRYDIAAELAKASTALCRRTCRY